MSGVIAEVMESLFDTLFSVKWSVLRLWTFPILDLLVARTYRWKRLVCRLARI